MKKGVKRKKKENNDGCWEKEEVRECNPEKEVS